MTIRINLSDTDRTALTAVRDDQTSHPALRDRAALLLLLGQGVKLADAADQVGKCYEWARSLAHRWPQEGLSLVAPISHAYTTRKDLARREEAAAQRRAGATQTEIARHLGVSKQRVAQLLRDAARLGIDTDLPPQGIYTITRLCRETGHCAAYLRKVAVSLGFNTRRRLTEAQAQAVREAATRRCVVCGADISHRFANARSCPEHRPEAVRQWRHRIKAEPATLDTTMPGQLPRLALQALENVPPPGPDSPTVTWTEAKALIGLTPTQLAWLIDRGIIWHTPDPTGAVHRVTKRPIRLYSRDQLEALAAALTGRTSQVG